MCLELCGHVVLLVACVSVLVMAGVPNRFLCALKGLSWRNLVRVRLLMRQQFAQLALLLAGVSFLRAIWLRVGTFLAFGEPVLFGGCGRRRSVLRD